MVPRLTEWRQGPAGAAQPPSGPLYHYTTAAGCEGILRSNQLWATNPRYLNDSSELSHGQELFVRVCERLQSAFRTPRRRRS
jgi:hypothetical protein